MARPMTIVKPPISGAAMRVKGKVNEKISTPRHAHNAACVSSGSVTRLLAVALLSSFMYHRSTMPRAAASQTAEQVFLGQFERDFMDISSQHDLLPSVRQLTQRYRISPVTVT